MSGYDPSTSPKGTGSRIVAVVLAILACVALTAAYRLHAFWWQP